MKNYIEIFPDAENVLAVFSTRQAGDLRKNKENQIQFFEQFDVDFNNVVQMDQVHGSNVEYVDGSKSLITKTDGIFTDKKGIYTAVNTADCLPIFIYSPEPEFVGIIHAGWRSLFAQIIKNFFQKANKKFNIDFSQVKAVIGPCIHKCCYEIKEDVLDEFGKYRNFIIEKDNKIFVDLPQIAKFHLTKMKIREYNIELIDECTCCLSNKYFSYRRDKQNMEGEMLGLIGLK